MTLATLNRPWLLCLLCGAAAAAALPPVYLWPGLLGFAVLAHLLHDAPSLRAAAWRGWCFGYGYFLAGLYWVGIAFFAEAETFGPFAVPAVLALAAVLALFAALAGLAARLRRWRSVTATGLALALAWTATEVARVYVPFGGFPWNPISLVWTGTVATMQSAALVGSHGLSLLTVAAAASAAAWWRHGRRARAPLIALAGFALLTGYGLWRTGTVGAVDGVRLRLVQPNIGQHHKWDEDLRQAWFERHLAMSAQAHNGVTHVVWPEAASGYPLDRDRTARAMVANATPPGGLLLAGGERFDFSAEPFKVWNSLYAVSPAAELVAVYDKATLVPFGEYLPLRRIMEMIGLEVLTRHRFDFQRGPGPRTLHLPGLPPVSPLICYEVIFPGHVADPRDRPGWLLNVTNDAWFGVSSGPYQHLAMARMRAVEEGLPLVRAANTGISAVADPYGRVLSHLELATIGVLDAALPAALAPPAYARLRPFPALVLALLAAAAVLWIERPGGNPHKGRNR